MILATLVLTAACSPAHAFDRLPAVSEANDIIAVARFGGTPSEARFVQAAATGDAGLDSLFAAAGSAGSIKPKSGRGAVGTYAVKSVAPGKVVIGLNVDFLGNIIEADLTVALGGSASVSIDGSLTAPGEAKQPFHRKASGNYSYDAGAGRGTISYVADGDIKTESFTKTASGIEATILGMPHVFTKTR